MILVVLLAQCGSAILRFASLQSAAAQPERGSDELGIIELNQPAQRNISSGQSHQFAVPIKSEHFLRISVAPTRVGLRAAFVDPQHQALIETSCHYDEQFLLFIIPDQSGTYFLKISTCDLEPVAGSYRTIVEEHRPATPADHTRVAAEQLMVEAEKLRAGSDITLNRSAVAKYQEALELWRSIGDRSAEAAALRSLGELLRKRGERDIAFEYFNLALIASRRAKSTEEESKVLNELGYSQTLRGRYDEALELGSRALTLARSRNDLHVQAQALSNLAEAYYDRGELAQALECVRDSLRIWQNLGNRRGQAQALLRAGYIKTGLGEVQGALSDYQQALQLSRAIGENHGRAFIFAAIGHFYSETGSKQKALAYYDQATVLSQQFEDPFIRAELNAGMGYVYYELGEFEKALSYQKQALSLYSQLGDRWAQAALYLAIGKTYHSMGDSSEALNQYRDSALLIRSLSNTRLESYLLIQTGEVHEQLGDRIKALVNFQRALALTRSDKNLRGQATVLNKIGKLNADLGNQAEGLRNFNQALPLVRAISDRFGESITLTNIATVERDRHNLSVAEETMESAIHLIEALRSNVVSRDLRASYFATVRQSYELYADLLMRLDQEQPAHGYKVKAFEMSERARARILLETLSGARPDIREGVDDRLLNRERSIEYELNAKAGRYGQLVSAGNTAEAEVIDRDINQLTAEYDDVREQIRNQSPHYAALTQPEPLSLEEIQRQVLDEDSLLLEYMLCDERSYLWAVTRSEITSYQLPGRFEIEKASRQLYSSLTANQSLPNETLEERQTRVVRATEDLHSQIANLSKVLLEPLGPKLHKKRLLIVADGPLQYIPFQILTTRNGGEPLLADHEIVNQPSASTLALLLRETTSRNSRSGTVAVFADPVFEKNDPRVPVRTNGTLMKANVEVGELRRALSGVSRSDEGSQIPRLLASRVEAEAITSVSPWWTSYKAIGFEASRATAMKPELADYRVIHFATHALLNSKHAELSGIVLSMVDENGQPQDGFLRLHDIYNLKLPVDLVVLSACNTALGKDVRGEGLIGLTRGFMYAGASSVVASLWKVDDEATAELMRHFYKFMLQDNLSPPAALRAAQLEMRKEKRWQSPYYWSGFIIQGQYVQPEPVYRFPWKSVAVFAVPSAVLMAAMILLIRRRRKYVF